MPGSGLVQLPGLVAMAPGSGRHHDAAGLGLPPGIDDRAALAADLAVVPHPRFGIDPFADRAQQPQARQVVLVDHWSPHLMNARMAVGAV